jgi:hypothetical protein
MQPDPRLYAPLALFLTFLDVQSSVAGKAFLRGLLGRLDWSPFAESPPASAGQKSRGLSRRN